jgi:hypothetical protein
VFDEEAWRKYADADIEINRSIRTENAFIFEEFFKLDSLLAPHLRFNEYIKIKSVLLAILHHLTSIERG